MTRGGQVLHFPSITQTPETSFTLVSKVFEKRKILDISYFSKTKKTNMEGKGGEKTKKKYAQRSKHSEGNFSSK